MVTAGAGAQATAEGVAAVATTGLATAEVPQFGQLAQLFEKKS